MLSLTPRTVRRTLLPASYLVFIAGTLASGAIFYHGRSFDVKAAILSDLQSPDENPHGYKALAAGIALSATLLVPSVIVFYRQLCGKHPRLATAGAVMFAVGTGSAIAVGVLAPFTHGYSPLHVQLASAAFIGIAAGTVLYLLAARASRTLLFFQLGVLLLLAFLCYGPIDFDNSHLLTGLAFWEWVLLADCGVALWALARVIESNG